MGSKFIKSLLGIERVTLVLYLVIHHRSKFIKSLLGIESYYCVIWLFLF